MSTLDFDFFKPRVALFQRDKFITYILVDASLLPKNWLFKIHLLQENRYYIEW